MVAVCPTEGEVSIALPSGFQKAAQILVGPVLGFRPTELSVIKPPLQLVTVPITVAEGAP